jgi:hypothetical protein
VKAAHPALVIDTAAAAAEEVAGQLHMVHHVVLLRVGFIVPQTSTVTAGPAAALFGSTGPGASGLIQQAKCQCRRVQPNCTEGRHTLYQRCSGLLK